MVVVVVESDIVVVFAVIVVFVFVVVVAVPVVVTPWANLPVLRRYLFSAPFLPRIRT